MNSVTFTGALKRGGETQTLCFEIPTLTDPALSPKPNVNEIINTAIDAIIAHNNNQELHDLKWEITVNTLKAFSKNQRAIEKILGKGKDNPNVQRLNGSRETEITEHHKGSGFKTVSIHRLRALYGAIAIHFFCPDNQHVHRFLQNYLGHVLEKDISASNSRATDHYFHYYLIDDNGTPITARGIKLEADTTLPENPQAVHIPQQEAVELLAPPLSNTPVVESQPLPKDTHPTVEPHKRDYTEIPPESVQPIVDLSRTLALLEAVRCGGSKSCSTCRSTHSKSLVEFLQRP